MREEDIVAELTPPLDDCLTSGSDTQLPVTDDAAALVPERRL